MGVVQDGLVLWLDARAQRQLMKDGQSKSIWKDLSGNGNDGQLMNFDFTEDSGWVDGGLKFDGVDDYVRVPNVLNMDGDFTVEIWAESDVYNTARALFNTNARVSSPWNDKGFFITNIFNPLYLYFGINDGINGYVIRAINYISTFNNSHIVVKREGNMMYSFFNYTRQNSLDISSYESFKTNNDITIAKGYKGKVKIVRIYDRALSNEEILQNYRATHFLLEPKTFTSTSYYNFYDLNRVEINTLATKDLIEVLRGDINLEDIDFDRDMKSIPFADVLNRVERNINILGNKLYKPKGWTQPKLDWTYNQPFSYVDANRLERNLLLLYNYAKGNIDNIPHCGMYTCGEEVV